MYSIYIYKSYNIYISGLLIYAIYIYILYVCTLTIMILNTSMWVLICLDPLTAPTQSRRAGLSRLKEEKLQDHTPLAGSNGPFSTWKF